MTKTDEDQMESNEETENNVQLATQVVQQFIAYVSSVIIDYEVRFLSTMKFDLICGSVDPS